MTETKLFDYLVSHPCFEFVFLVIGYYLLFAICNLFFPIYQDPESGSLPPELSFLTPETSKLVFCYKYGRSYTPALQGIQ